MMFRREAVTPPCPFGQAGCEGGVSMLFIEGAGSNVQPSTSSVEWAYAYEVQ
ncbi:MAG: hypothetical protein ACHQQQ_14915 [Bacteroidota bacterium]